MQLAAERFMRSADAKSSWSTRSTCGPPIAELSLCRCKDRHEGMSESGKRSQGLNDRFWVTLLPDRLGYAAFWFGVDGRQHKCE